jgi:hypothetical protein
MKAKWKKMENLCKNNINNIRCRCNRIKWRVKKWKKWTTCTAWKAMNRNKWKMKWCEI